MSSNLFVIISIFICSILFIILYLFFKMSPFISYKRSLGIFFYYIYRTILIEKIFRREYDINYIIHEYAQNLNTENYNKRSVDFWNYILKYFYSELVIELNRKKASIKSIYYLEGKYYEKVNKNKSLGQGQITEPEEIKSFNVNVSFLSRNEIENLKRFQNIILEKSTILGSTKGYYHQAMRYGFFFFYLEEKISPNSTHNTKIEDWKKYINYKGESNKNDRLVEKPFHITKIGANSTDSNNFSKSSVKKNILEMLDYFETIEFKMGIDKIYKLCKEENIDLKN